MEKNLVKPEVEKRVWRASEVELDEMEKALFLVMMKRAIGVKKLSELKEMGDVKAVKAGLTVNMEIGKSKILSMFFARRYNTYEYRNELFYQKKEELR